MGAVFSSILIAAVVFGIPLMLLIAPIVFFIAYMRGHTTGLKGRGFTFLVGLLLCCIAFIGYLIIAPRV